MEGTKMKYLKNVIQGVKYIPLKLWSYLTAGNSGISLLNVKGGFLDLKKNYRRSFLLGIIISVFLHGSAIGVFFISSMVNPVDSSADEKTNLREINIVELPPPPVSQNEEAFIPPPEAPESENVTSLPKKDLKALVPEPVRKEKAEEQTVKTQQELNEINTPVSKDGDTSGFEYTGELGYIEEEKIEEKITEEKVIPPSDNKNYNSFEVEKAPDAVNLSQIKSSIRYPEIAVQAGIEGRVTVRVLVNKEGRVIDIGKLTGPVVFHDEVEEKVRQLRFTPGLQNGNPVRVWVTVPFNFELN